MDLLKILYACTTSFFIKKAIMKAIKDSVDICLAENRGLGCLYYTVIPKDGNVSVREMQKDYVVIVNHNQQYYHIVKDNIVVFQGDYRRDQDPFRIAEHDFRVYRGLSTAIEMASLGMWKTFENYVRGNYKTILKDIDYMDVHCGLTAHGLKLRVET